MYPNILNENQHNMSHFEILRHFVVGLIYSVAKGRPNKQLTCTKTSPFLTDFHILCLMCITCISASVRFFSELGLMVGEVTFSWFSFLPCGPPSVTFGDTALKLEFCTFKLCFFCVSMWNQITLAWLLCHLGLRDFWPAFAHCVVLPCQNLEPHLRLLRWSLVQSFFDFYPIADVGLDTTIDLYAACKLGWTCFFVVVAWGKVRSKTCDTKTVLHSNWNLQFKSCK